MRSYNFPIIVFILLVSCATSQKPPEIKYDSRGRVISYFLGKIDTVYFDENSAVVKPIFQESIALMADYVLKNNKNVFLNSYWHELETNNIANKRIDSVLFYFERNGLSKSRIFRRTHTPSLPIDEDNFPEEERARYRFVTMQITD